MVFSHLDPSQPFVAELRNGIAHYEPSCNYRIAPLPPHITDDEPKLNVGLVCRVVRN